MDDRPDQINVDRFFDHGKRHPFSTNLYEITWHDGWMVKYKVIKIEEGSQAPLKKTDEEKVNL